MRFLSRKNKVVDNSVDISEINQRLAETFGIDISGVPIEAMKSTTYFACMQIRCNAIAKIPIKVMRFKDGSSITAVKHPLYKLLKCRPNPYMTPHDFLWATEFQRIEYGNAYWVKTTSKGKLTGLYLLNSPSVNVIYDDACILSNSASVYYIYHDSKEGEILYTSDDIVHFKNFPKNGIIGQPIKKYISEVVDSEKYGRNVIKQKSKDGLQDPIIVQYTGDLNKDKNKAIKNKFASLGGSSNAGKVVPIPTDFTVTQLETKLVNSQFFELQGLNTKQIANAFGVKSFQLNDLEKSTYNNVQQQTEAFYTDTMQNVYTSYEQEIDYKLFYETEIKNGYYTKFNIDALLRSDIEKRYNAYAQGISAGFLKISEAREKEDLKFEEGTDKLIIGNGASIPLSDLGKQYSAKGGEN